VSRRVSGAKKNGQKPPDGERLELLARIASLYYEDRLTQEDIAAQTGYSRSMISRFLTEARDLNVVEVRVNHPLGRQRELEQALEAALGLKTVRVLARGTLDYGQMMRRLGTLGARMVEELVQDNTTLGVSWGMAVWELTNALRPQHRTGVHVVQMMGALAASEPETDGPELARRLARIFGGRYTTLPMPLIVDSEAVCRSLREDQRFKRMTMCCRDARLALIGVGTTDPERSSMLRAGYLTETQLQELREAGVVGDVCALHYNLRGELVDTPLTRRMVTVDAATLKAIPTKLAVAGGQYKAATILGACRAGFIDLLVTDDVAANGVLSLLHSEKQK
jgi:DNA-binding transcriptional regulator LsrR (DeoR family)